MNGTVELLNYIYQNSQMGIETIPQLMDLVDHEQFRKQLQSQYNEYKTINDEALKLLNMSGFNEQGISALDKIRAYLMINLQTITDRSVSHIAEMLITGSTMGVIDAVRNTRKYKDVQPEIVHLMGRLQTFEENNIETLKMYL